MCWGHFRPREGKQKQRSLLWMQHVLQLNIPLCPCSFSTAVYEPFPNTPISDCQRWLTNHLRRRTQTQKRSIPMASCKLEAGSVQKGSKSRNAEKHLCGRKSRKSYLAGEGKAPWVQRRENDMLVSVHALFWRTGTLCYMIPPSKTEGEVRGGRGWEGSALSCRGDLLRLAGGSWTP